MATTPGADLASWVLGPALAAALYLEGLFPLHASACVVDGKAWGFSGPSQAGKSTLLRGLVDRGAGMLTDDFLVFDPATGLAQPGRPSVRLWQDALARLEDEAQRGAAPLSADLPKFVVPTEDAFHPSPAPLAGVVFLSPVYADHLELEDLPGRVGLAALLQNAHFPYLLDALERRGPHLGYATRAASALQLLEARRPRTVQRLDALVEAVLERISDQA